MSSILTMLEFTTDADFDEAKVICRAQGYGDSTAYCSTSDVPGLYCLPTRKGASAKGNRQNRGMGFRGCGVPKWLNPNTGN